MILLIDAYNVLKQLHDGEMISEQQRRSFIKQLAAYKRLRSHKKIIVVFDGGSSSWPTEEKIRGITVVYSGNLRTADEYMHSFIQEHKAKSASMVLVSSDRQLCTFASDNNIASIDAQEFYALVQRALKPPASKKAYLRAVKTAESSIPELDMLMQEASTMVEDKKEDLPQQEWKKRPKKKLSKRERILEKKLKKL